MATHDYIISNASGAAVRSDLNNALAAIVSNNSAATEPTTTYAYMWWADTTAGQLKIRNATNDGWVVIQELDGTLLMEDGTVGAPGLAFASDLDTGFYRPAANQLAVATNGVERVEFGTTEVVFNDGGEDINFRIEGDTDANLFFVDAGNDRVGIGTTAPQGKLYVAGPNATSLGVSADAAINIAASSGALIGRRINLNYAVVDSATNAAAAMAFEYTSQAGFGNGDILFATRNVTTDTAPTERARIDSSGRLLVGTSTSRDNWFNTSSQSPLIQSESSSGQNFFSGTYTSTGGGGAIALLGKARGTSYQIVNAGDTLGRLSFQGADGSEMVEAAAIAAEVDTTPGANDMPGRLVFSTTADGASSPTERMRITSLGYLKASNTGSYNDVSAPYHETCTNQPDWALHVSNTHGSNPYGVLVSHSTVKNNTSNWFFYAQESASLRFQVRSNGGIANYQGNDANLCDEREKKNIETLDSTWSCLKNWELKKFHYNEDADSDDKRYGVIAQQVAEHCPEVITDWVKQEAKDAVLDDDGNVVTSAQEEIVRMGVREQQMYWMAIKALQEAQLRIETLEAKVAALEAQ